MTKSMIAAVAVSLLLLVRPSAAAPTSQPVGSSQGPATQPATKVVDYEGVGIVVVRHSFFEAAKSAVEGQKDYAPPRELLADRLLVTRAGVFSFLESPKNKELVEKIAPGTAITVRGKLYAAGDLLLLDSAAPATDKPDIDLDKFRKAGGEIVTLDGKNRCQCALDLAGLSRSCTLGHLHHLQTADGSLYHYLPIGGGAAALMGEKSHNRAVRVEAMLLPGRQLLVTRVEPK